MTKMKQMSQFDDTINEVDDVAEGASFSVVKNVSIDPVNSTQFSNCVSKTFRVFPDFLL